MATRYRIDPDALAYAARRAGFARGSKISRKRLAQAADVPSSTVTNCLRGTANNPSASTVLQLADALGCEPRDLMI